MLYTIKGLHEGARGVSIRVRIIMKGEIRTVQLKDGSEHTVTDMQVADRTGTILLTLWDEMIDAVNEGDVIDIYNGYIKRFRGRLRLNVGKTGSLEKIRDEEFPTKKELRKHRIRW